MLFNFVLFLTFLKYFESSVTNESFVDGTQFCRTRFYFLFLRWVHLWTVRYLPELCFYSLFLVLYFWWRNDHERWTYLKFSFLHRVCFNKQRSSNFKYCWRFFLNQFHRWSRICSKPSWFPRMWHHIIYSYHKEYHDCHMLSKICLPDQST